MTGHVDENVALASLRCEDCGHAAWDHSDRRKPAAVCIGGGHSDCTCDAYADDVLAEALGTVPALAVGQHVQEWLREDTAWDWLSREQRRQWEEVGRLALEAVRADLARRTLPGTPS